jgi:hypothetical protein
LKHSSDSSQRSNFVSLKTISRFFQAAWWRHNWQFALAYIPIFKTPIILSTLAGIIMLTCFSFLSSINMRGTIDGNVLIPTLIGSTAGLIITGILLILSLFIGLIRIAGFTRAFLRCPYDQANPSTLSSIKSYLDEGLASVRSHKMFLSKSWLICSIIMVPLLFVWCAASFIAVGLTPEVVQTYQLGPEVTSMRNGSIVAMAIVGLLLSNYSITMLAVSTMLDRSVKETSIESLWLAITTSPVLSLVSLLVLVAVSAITTPYSMLAMLKPALQAKEVLSVTPLSYVNEVWQGLSGLIVIPMGMAMLLEVVRDSVVISESGKSGADKNSN